jgi:hypothetical protein
MKAADTSDRAWAIQAAILKSMSGEQRLELAFELSRTVRSLTAARLWQENPAMSHREFIRRFIHCVLPPQEIPRVLR